MAAPAQAPLWREPLWSLRGFVARHRGAAALRDAGALGIGALLSQTVFFVSAPLVLRLYDPSDFGRYTFAYSTISLIATIITWKAERLIVVVPARATAIRLLVAVLSTAIGGGLLLLGVVLVLWPLAWHLQMQQVADFRLIWLAPVSVLILAATAGVRLYTIRTGRFRHAAAAQIARAAVFAAGIIGSAFLSAGLGSAGAIILLSWQVLADVTALAIQLHANRETVGLIVARPRIRQSFGVLLRHRKTVGALAVSEVIRALNQQLPVATVALAFGATPAGWYALATAFVSGPASVVALSVGDVTNQRLSRIHAAGGPIAHLLRRTTVAMAAAGLVPFAAVALLAPTYLPVVMGAKWQGASHTVAVIAISAYLWFVTEPATNVPLIVGARRYLVLWHAVRLANWVCFGAAAVCGLVTYNTWIVLTVAGGFAVYALELVVGFVLARTADRNGCFSESGRRLARSRLGNT